MNLRKLKTKELNRISNEDFKSTEKTRLIVILDNVRSLNNIGSVFRTADAYLVEKIYLCGITACPPNKDIHKTALGATDSVDWEYAESTVEVVRKLRDQGTEVFAIEQVENSMALQDFEPENNKTYAIILGNEVKGVDQEAINHSNGALELPQFGTKHSLNISVCSGIVIWELFKKMNLQ